MTFPATPLPIGVELYVDSAWEDITPYVYSRDAIDVRRGKSSEGGLVDPSSMSLTLDNRDGRWSPRNPSSPYYGKIGRNTPIRAWVENGEVRQPAGAGYYFSAADSAALSITGDIDLRVDVWMPSWRLLASSFIGLFKSGSYGLYVTTAGYLVMYWSADGTNYNTLSSSEPIPGSTVGRKAVRATLDVNNGAGGKTARFYYSDDDTISGTWVEFGSANTTAGTTSIFNSTNALITTFSWRGECYDIEVRNGIAGSIVAKPAFTTRTAGASSFADSYGNTWTGAGGATVSNRHYRFWGEVTTWPQRWDRSGRDIYAPIECSGILRRIGQGNSPSASTMRHGVPTLANLVAYWPLEDADGSTTLQAVTAGTRDGELAGAVDLAAYDGFVCSDSIPTMNTGRLLGRVSPYTNTDEFRVRFLLRLASTIANNTVIARIFTNNSLGWMDLIYQTTSGGQLYLQPYTNLGVATTAGSALAIYGPSPGSTGLNGVTMRFEVAAQKNGAGIDFRIADLSVGSSTSWSQSHNVASATLGTCKMVWFNPNTADLADTAVGHIVVESVYGTASSMFDLKNELKAYHDEEAAYRVYRVGNDYDGIDVWSIGVGGESELMGYQTQNTPLGIIREAEASDGGILYEQRQAYGLAYRSLESLLGQSVVVSLDYAGENLARFEPVDDDQNTRNKATVTRIGGTAATVEDTTSSMSTQDPPNGVGLYDTSASLSLARDEQALQRAGWLVHAGTVDEARWPSITVNLAHPDFVADPMLTRQILTADIGDRLTVANPPSWVPPDDIDQIIIGTSETFSQFEHSITFVCVPASPYRAATLDAISALDSRWDADSSLNGAHNSSTTSLSVALDDGVLWDDGDGDFDIIVGGERMTVTAVSGTSSPQTFTVTRSVNGVVKSHGTGEAVALFAPTYYIP